MDALGKLFGSVTRVKLLRLFLFNDDSAFTAVSIAERTKVAPAALKRELAALMSAGIVRKKGTGAKVQYVANVRYKHAAALESFLRATDHVQAPQLLAALGKVGTLKLVALSGFFTSTTESKIDLLVVGDAVSDRSLAKAVAGLEAELGREIRYASFATADFRYRLGVYDRLIRDVFDYPHRLLVDKIGL